MREISVHQVTKAVAELCQDANIYLDPKIEMALKHSMEQETSSTAKAILEELIENAQIARSRKMPICQDTGMAVVHIKIGQEVHFIDGSLEAAIHEGVRQGYLQGYLRASVVRDPLQRENTKDNTPAVILWDMIMGDKVEITVAPKGFGSENMSSLTMLSPSQGIEGVKQAVLDTVKKAGSNPCPPIILGVGIGGTMDMACRVAKLALLRPLGMPNLQAHIAQLEKELLFSINELGIGPSGLGGKTTALAIHIDTYPTHIAGLPVAVNMSCHATRHQKIIL